MGKVVMGIGMSHSPLLALPAERWGERGADDMRNPGLNLIDGRLVDYPTVVRERGEHWGHEAVIPNYQRLEEGAQRALDRLADDIEKVSPDVVVIVGDDHYELFSAANMPAIGIYHGKEALSHEQSGFDEGHWRTTVAPLYAMDAVHRFPVHAELAEELVRGLVARDFDIGSSACVEDPTKMGFGHAYGFVVERLFRGRTIPMVPVMLNTYFPPNVPTPRRCYNLGVAIRDAIAENPRDLRVAVIGSGGLSHFIVEEELDNKLLNAFRSHDADTLRSIPVEALKSGSSEILCWIAAAGAFRGLPCQWSEYFPTRRTPAGTGIGMAFGAWY